MNIHKAQKKAAKDPLGLTVLWRSSMYEGEGITAEGQPVNYLIQDDRWKIFRELGPQLTWNDIVADDWEIRKIWL